jgi:acyl-CoA synthetase (AMP-forming)/AMP-acid ligase II
LGFVLKFVQEDLLGKVWLKHALERPSDEAIVHWSADDGCSRWTFSNLVESAMSYREDLIRAGVSQGDVCAFIIRHNEKLYPLYLATVFLGAIPAILAYPNARLHPDKFRQGLLGMARRSGLDWFLTEAELAPELSAVIDDDQSNIKGCLFPLDWGTPPRNSSTPAKAAGDRIEKCDPASPCLLQHSSGTTGLQKAVVLSHRAVLTHLEHYGRSIQLSPDDKVVSWLPLYHDMGLIAAFHLPLAWGIPSVQIDPFEWVQNPAVLMQAISGERGTISWLPNFSYNFMADRIRDDELERVSLESVRMLINCSEPVREHSHEAFLKRFAGCGLKESSLAACYAMAETVFAATQTPPGVRAPILQARSRELSRGVFVEAAPDDAIAVRTCVSSGAPIPGCEIRVTTPEGTEAKSGQVGELAIKSDAMFDGYRNYDEKTAEVLRDGWYLSGDYGFLHDDQCYVIGRTKDLIIVAGHNIAPEDVENATNGVDNVIPGRTVAFGLYHDESGTERVCIVAETHAAPETQLKRLIGTIRQAVMQIDVTVHGVYLVPHRWLFKTSSGKLCRKTNKQRILREFDNMDLTIHGSLIETAEAQIRD